MKKLNISDNTLKLLKRAANQDYSTPWKPIPDNEPLATGTLARTFPQLNNKSDDSYKSRQRDSVYMANNVLRFNRDSIEPQFQP